MPFRRICILCTALVLLIPCAASAQEQQVALDQDGAVFVIDRDLRDRLNLFQDVSGFQEASLFEVDGESFELVIQYRRNDRTLRERRTLSAEDVDNLRTWVTRRIRETRTVVDLNQEGRYGFLAATTYLSSIEGALIGDALGASDDGVATMSLIGGAVGFFAPLIATRNATVTEGEADMTFYGGVQGFVHGLQLYGLIEGDGDDLDEGRALSGLSAALGAGESILYYSIARRNAWTGGHAEMTSFTGLSGNLIGLGLTAGFGGEDPNVPTASSLSLAGSFVGGYLGHRMGRTDQYTQGDARIYLLSGLQAANLSGSLAAANDAGDGRGVALAVTGAGTAGLLLGRLLVRDRDFSKSQGNITILGAFAGSLLGGGFAEAADAENDTIALLQAAGSLVGSGITYGLFAADARRQAHRQTGDEKASVDLDLEISPTAARIPMPDGRFMRVSDTVVPQVTLRARF